MISERFLEDVRIQIEMVLHRGIRSFCIFPFGEVGVFVKEYLNQKGMQDVIVADNYRCKERDIIPASGLSKYKDRYVLFAVYKNELRYVLKEELLEYVSEDQVIDLGGTGEKYALIESYYYKEKAILRGYDKETKIYHLKSHDVSMYLPYYDYDLIQKSIVDSDAYFEEALLRYVTKVFHNGVIEKKMKQGLTLDIGANIGNHTLYYVKECGAKNVISYEPVGETFQILCKNIKINHLEKNVCAQNVAIGAHRALAKSILVIENLGGASVEECKDVEIDIISIDEQDLEDVQFMKIDVEGFEINVLNGAIETIKKYRPYIVIEVSNESGHIYEVLSTLMPLGYDAQRISKMDYLFSPNYV